MGIYHVKTSPVADGPDPNLIRPSDWNSQHVYSLQDAASLSGNTAGALALISTGTLYLAGGNNVTLFQSGNSVTVSGPNLPAAQTGISGLSAGAGLATSGTVSFANSNGLAWGLSGQTLTGSYTVPAVPPETPFGLSAGTQSVSTGTLKFADSNGISFGMSGSSQVTASYTVPAVTAGSDTLGVSNLGNTSGTSGVVSGDQVRVLFAGGNNITLSQSLNGASATITISGPNAGGAQTGLSSLAASGGTQTAGMVSFADSNGLTFGMSTGAVTGTVTASYTVPTVTAGSDTFGMSNLGNTSGTTGVVSGDSVRYLLAGGNNVTLSQSLNGLSGTLTISAAAQTVQTQLVGGLAAGTQTATSGTVVFSDSNGISFGMSGSSRVTASYTVPSVTAGSDTAGISNLGNTAGTSGVVSGDSIRVLFAGGNNVTLSQSVDAGNRSATVTISGASTFAQLSAGVSNVGNTSGDTGVFTGRVVFAGGNNITLSGSSNAGSVTYTISAPNLGAGAGFTAGVSNLGNTSGNTGTVSASLVLAGGNNVTLSQATAAGGAATVTVSAANQPVIGAWKHFPGAFLSTAGGMQEDATLVLYPFQVPAYLTAHTFQVWLSATGATGSTAGASLSVGVYTQTGSTLSLASSGSLGSTWTSGTVAASDWSGVSGIKQWRVTNQTFNFTPGNYVAGVWHRSTNAGSYSMMGISGGAAVGGPLGQVADNFQGNMPWMGKYTASTTGMPAAVSTGHVSRLMNAGANNRFIDFMFYNSTWGY